MELSSFFEQNNKVAIAFSGGVDSAFLLYAAMQYAKEVRAYYVKTPFQPQFELNDAKRLAGELKADMSVLTMDIFGDEQITNNPVNRCYFCKQKIYGEICRQAHEDGFEVILDGTNASDDVADRPGMKALEELQVKSPLRECGLTKEEIRRLSKAANLFTWDKPSYACLATRIPTGERITPEKLERTEWAESFLATLGFRDFRVRSMENIAKLQVRESQLELLLQNRKQIADVLMTRYSQVLLDLNGR